jgi:hypothetical protein
LGVTPFFPSFLKIESTIDWLFVNLEDFTRSSNSSLFIIGQNTNLLVGRLNNLYITFSTKSLGKINPVNQAQT